MVESIWMTFFIWIIFLTKMLREKSVNNKKN